MIKRASAILMLSTFAVLACSQKSPKTHDGTGPVAPLQHKGAECPALDGDFEKDSTNRKSLKITKLADGVKFIDSETEYYIDGQSRILDGNKDLTYKGACEANAILIDVYADATYLGRMRYSKINEEQLLIETTSLDDRLGNDGKEIWQADHRR